MASSTTGTDNNASGAGNSARVQRLQATLNDVLSDLDSLGGANPSSSLFASSPAAASSSNTTTNLAHLFGGGNSNSGSLNAFGAANPAMRPSAALGVSPEDLLLAAAAEKRRLNANVAYIRQRALEERLYRQQQQQQQEMKKGASLLGLFHQSLGGGAAGLAGMCATNPNPMAHNSGLGSLLAYKYGRPSAFAGHLLNPKHLELQQPAAPEASNTTLEALGTSLRKSSSPYVDVASLEATVDPADPVITKTRGGVTDPFPQKLHRMLEYAAENGHEEVVSFYSHGRAFGIHDPEAFAKDIMPKFFKQSRLSSFQRQLNLYGFRRITSGPDAGGYYHELFLKARPKLCLHMRRVGLPKGEDRRKMRSKNVQVEPDFYNMAPPAVSHAS